MKSVEFVPQLHKSGCGVACIAMILGCDYQEALKIVHPNRHLYKRRRPKYGTSLVQISKALKKKKAKFTVKFVDGHKLKSLKNPAILGIRWPKNNGKKSHLPKHWHWVVCSKGKILDPFTFGDHVGYSVSYCQKKTFVIFEVKGKRK